MISRRDLVTGSLALAAGLLARPAALGGSRQSARATIDTVTGPVLLARLGVTLMHEHVLVDFIGAADVSPSRYDRDQAFAVILPHLRQLASLGCETLVECTPAYLGRDVELLRRLSSASGLTILTNTGIYGAASDKHLPAFAFSETAEQLSGRWTREWTDGIDGTGIKPAFMKIGVDGAPLSDIDAKLVRAAASTTRATGLTVASHTGSGAAALEELAILETAGAPLSSFIWVHAQSEKDRSFHVRVAERGAWVEFDGVGPSSVDDHVALVRNMKDRGLLSRVLVSHDAGWYHVGEPGGGKFRPFDTLFTSLVPALKANGFTESQVRQLLIENPRNALSGAP